MLESAPEIVSCDENNNKVDEGYEELPEVYRPDGDCISLIMFSLSYAQISRLKGFVKSLEDELYLSDIDMV